LLVFDWQVMNLEYLIQICGFHPSKKEN